MTARFPRTAWKIPRPVWWLIVAVAAGYAGIQRAGFVYLDFPAIVENPTLRPPHTLWRALFPPAIPGVTVQGRPLVNLSLALNHAVGGMNPVGYHLFNLAVHAAAAVALYGLCRRTLIRRRVAEPGLWAWLIAAVWALHPLCTEAVAYTIQRAESLMGLFYLLTLLAFARAAGAGTGGRRWLLLSWLTCLAGMATKEVMVSAPVIVLLYDRTFFAGSARAAWERRRWYYLALAGTWLPLALLVRSTGGNRGGTAGFDLGLPMGTYWLTQGPALWHYLRLVVWPHPLIFFYEVRWYSPSSAALPVLGIGLLLAATAAGLWRRTVWGLLGAVFFAVLAPTSLVPGLTQTLAEHRMYLALAPLVAGLVLAGRAVCLRYRLPTAAWAGCCFLGAALAAVATARRTAVYANEVALWTDTVAKAPANPYSRNNLALALISAGRTGEAVVELEKVVAAAPAYAEAHTNLGLALAHLGRLPDAIAEDRAGLALKPTDPAARTNLGVALAGIGRYDEAMTELRRAVADDPLYLPARNDLAAVLAGLGRFDAAIEQYRLILEQAPAAAETRFNFGTVLAKSGRWKEAAENFADAAALAPEKAEMFGNLGVALAQLGRFPEAVAADREAVRLAPNDPDLRQNLELAQRAADQARVSPAGSPPAPR